MNDVNTIFWKWAEENINRDEFCRRCFTAAEREAAMDKILGITPQERGETVPPEAAQPCVTDGTDGADRLDEMSGTGVTESEPDAASHAQSRLVTVKKENILEEDDQTDPL